MAHYAKVNSEVVIDIVVANQDWVDAQPDKWAWIETSYNIHQGIYYDSETGEPHPDQSLATATAGRKRKNYAAVGFRYDKELDAFIPPTPYPSWVLDTKTCDWTPPIPYPQDQKRYVWNEAKQEWTYTGFYLENGEVKKENI
jgi:hypothetical protein